MTARLVLGAWMAANGINHLLGPMWAEPVAHAALATQLLTAFDHSGLLDVAMVIELATGVLLLAGLLVPLALCVLMPVSTCALFWAVLDMHPGSIAMALVAFLLNALLMLAYLEHYRGALQRRAPTLGEA